MSTNQAESDGVGWTYSDQVKEHFMNPRNVLKVTEEEFQADGMGYVGSPACGDMMKVFIKVENNRIKDLKWQTFGCASAIGSTSVMSEMVLRGDGMTLDEASRLKPEDITDQLGGLPRSKIHCSVLGDKALRQAINDYCEQQGIDSPAAEKPSPVVCHCLNISEEDIRMEVLEGVEDWETLQARTKIGTGCGKCRRKAEKLMRRFLDDLPRS